MGQSSSSVPNGQRSRSFRRVSLGALGKKHFQTTPKILSHTFAYVDGSLKMHSKSKSKPKTQQVDQLNLNTATEEELMTLPGINRAVARNVVNHRQAIGRFNRVEDLALVSGVGAYKLELVRPEICVVSSEASAASSQASISMDSIGNATSLVDVNSASVFELQGIPGLNQELAANLVERRRRRGPYRSIKEIGKVRGFGKHRLALIQPYLKVVVDSEGSVTPTPSNSTSPSLWNNPQVTSTPISDCVDRMAKEAPRTNGINTKAQVSIHLETSSGISEEEIWELLSVASPRPLTPSNFTSRLDGRTSVRVASWNLESFTIDKACNPGVREVVCRTIFENRFSLIAMQEIESSEALAKITLELNTPTLKRVRDWQENRRAWRSVHLGEGFAILWDADAKLGISLDKEPSAKAHLLPLAACATFHINKLTVTIVNTFSRGSEDKKLIEDLSSYENSMVLGDFSILNSSESLDLELSGKENTAVLSEGYFFNDNIIWGRKSRELMSTGYSGIVKQGLTHLGIPRGWKWGGPVSNHCPVWCQIYTQPNSY